VTDQGLRSITTPDIASTPKYGVALQRSCDGDAEVWFTILNSCGCFGLLFQSAYTSKQRGILVDRFQHFFGELDSHIDLLLAYLRIRLRFNVGCIVSQKRKIVKAVE
jgi:hypothetical protein